MNSFPENPFDPEPGRVPPHMAGRPKVERRFSEALRDLREDDRGGRLVYLYGTPGAGATTLLKRLLSDAAAERVATVALLPGHLASREGVDRAARARAGACPAPVDPVPDGGDDAVHEAAIEIMNVLGRGKDGVLITLDDAHEAHPRALSGLLDTVQHVGFDRPLVGVLAGTPGLDWALIDSRVSFWDRADKLFVGPLDDEGAREALAQPFRAAGLEAGDEAISALAAAADSWPGFLQMYGRAAWEADAARRESFAAYCRTFSDAGMPAAARELANAFVRSAPEQSERRLVDHEIDAVLERHGDAREGYRFIASRGFVRDDRSGALAMAPGIPGLREYLIAHVLAP